MNLQAIKNALPWARDVEEWYSGVGLNVEVFSEDDMTFARLLELSEMFGTKTINIRHEEGSGGGCESCGYGADEDKYWIEVSDITRSPQ